MTKNMSTLDRRLRGFIAAPLLVVVALVIGAGTVAGIVVLALAAVMAAKALSASARSTPSFTSIPATRDRCRTEASKEFTAWT